VTAVGLYVQIPFCEAKCAYCHFAIAPRRPDTPRQQRYLDALLREMEASSAERADKTLLSHRAAHGGLHLPEDDLVTDLYRWTVEHLVAAMSAFRARYGVDPLGEYADALRDSFEAGLLEVVGDRLRLTEAGVLPSNEVFRAFV
jgi:coproporphyrinogen III oxidase-like Fe-S oxidoreductase